MTVFSFFFRATRKITFQLRIIFEKKYTHIILKGNGVKFNSSLVCNGIPQIDVHRTATFTIGNACIINSGLVYNPIGRYTPSFFMVRENATLKIGNNVGISSAALICQKEIIIDDNVKIGGGVCIYDTDFHSLNPSLRLDNNADQQDKKSNAVHIKSNVFIGAHSTILKGVTIGENAIIGACSVVARDVPDNEIWAGNPARFIKDLSFNKLKEPNN